MRSEGRLVGRRYLNRASTEGSEGPKALEDNTTRGKDGRGKREVRRRDTSTAEVGRGF